VNYAATEAAAAMAVAVPRGERGGGLSRRCGEVEEESIASSRFFLYTPTTNYI
jgi:hypothetical protein